MAGLLTAQETITELTDEIKWLDGQIQRKDGDLLETCTALTELARAAVNKLDVEGCIADIWARLTKRGVPLPPVPAVGPQPKARCQHCADLETKYGLEIHALQVELHAVRTIDEDLMKELSTDKQKATEQVRASHAEIRDLTDHIQALKADIASLRSTLAQKRDITLLTRVTLDSECIPPEQRFSVECQADLEDPKLHGLSVSLLDANTTISALQNDLLVANETLSAVRLELQAQQEEAQSLRKVVAAAAERETESRGVLGSLQSAVHQLSTDAAAKSAAITQLQADLARLTDEATRNNVIRNNLQKEVETLTVANVKLQSSRLKEKSMVDNTLVPDVSSEAVHSAQAIHTLVAVSVPTLAMESTVAVCCCVEPFEPNTTRDVPALRVALDSMKLEVQQSRREIDNLTSALSHATACWSQTEAAKAEAEEQLTDARAQVTVLRNLAHSADGELARRKQTIEELNGQMQLLQSSLATALADCKLHENEANIVREEIATLYQQYEKMGSELREHKMRLSAEEQKFSATERVLGSVKGELERERETSKTLRTEVASLRGDAARLSATVSNLRSEVDERTHDVSLLREQLTQERDVTQQLEARCSELSTAVASLETRLSVARQEATEAKDTCSAEVSVYKTELLELQLELDKADAERTRVQAALTACEASLEATKQQSERWSAQCKLLTSEVQRLSLVSEEQSEALAGAQETVKLQQSLLEEADERDSAMRVEVSEAQSQLLSIRRELELKHQQGTATIASLQESSQHTQASLLADLHTCERQLGKQREIEMTLRAELDAARKELIRLSSLPQELEALKAEASGYRVNLASMKGSQHRMTQQLQFMSDQLAQANHDKLELTKELEEMSDVVIRMESQLRQARGAQREAGR